ncbi:MAG TPA: GH25 family lysozyme [Acidimicrobiales bacterium]|nr:GH25 family lysozyme [Acidimicrobiales bacterium]
MQLRTQGVPLWLVAAMAGIGMGSGAVAGLPLVGAPTGAAAYLTASPESTAAAAVNAEAARAEVRLPANLRAPHAGTGEAVTHPASDHMGSGVPGGHGPRPLSPAGSAPAVIRLTSATVLTATANARGMDVASYQGNVDWAGATANGATFAYIKATEGTYYTDSTYFPEQYNGSYNAGMVRGAYHFAIPNDSTGAAQADYFVAHGGGWSADGRTLPGTLDIEYNPYGAECYGLSSAQMVGWIQSFDAEYQRLTGRNPTIYTTRDWWSSCTGNSAAFGAEGLAVANYSTTAGTLPASWSAYNIWQYADSGTFPGDQDVFNGSTDALRAFAYAPPGDAALACPTGDLRSAADKVPRSGVVVRTGSASAPVDGTYTVAPTTGALQSIATTVPSPSTPVVAVWQNGTDCSGSAGSRNAWAATSNGAVYGQSSQTGPAAVNFGDASGVKLVKPVVGMSPTSDGAGYWLVASDGGVFSYGTAGFHGSTGNVNLVQPVVGMAATRDNAGYWLVASDGGVFSFGDAPFYGSLGNVKLVRPIEAMVATPDGKGYWMVASDGGVFCFGDAVFRGSLGDKTLSAPIAGLVAWGDGYTLIGQDGRTYPFS